MHLIQLVQYLFKALEERVFAENADRFLCPNLVVILMLGVFELPFIAARALFVEEKNSAVVAMAFSTCEQEMEGLRGEVIPVERNASWEAEVDNTFYKGLIRAVFWRISVKNFRCESCF